MMRIGPTAAAAGSCRAIAASAEAIRTRRGFEKGRQAVGDSEEPTLDYGPAVAGLSAATPTELVELLTRVARPLGARKLVVYLVDFGHLVLQPLLLGDIGEDWKDQDWLSPDEGFVEQDIASSPAGCSFRTGSAVLVERNDGVRISVPLVEHTERTGVVALTVPEASDAVVSQCLQLGVFAGLLVSSLSRSTDLFHLRRQGRSMTAAAGMQWDLLPSMTIRGPSVVSTGLLEPAYQVAGDAFDHTINGEWLHLSVFDAMGHDLGSTVMTTLAVGVYRHARRARMSLLETHESIDAAVTTHCTENAFVTGVIAQVNLDSGELLWINAGHPAPLLLRMSGTVEELTSPPGLPFGFRDQVQLMSARLGPGESLLFYTDGVVESRPALSEELGTEQLARIWAAEVDAGATPEQVLRRVVQAAVDHQGGKLHDDATLLMVQRAHSQPAATQRHHPADPGPASEHVDAAGAAVHPEAVAEQTPTS